MIVFAVASWFLLAADPSTDEIAKAIRELGSDDYRVRTQASDWLWRAGKPAEESLRKALKNDDPEIVARSRRVLDMISAGIRPDDPRTLRELATRARSAPESWNAIVSQLLELGPRGLEVASGLADSLPGQPSVRAERRKQIDALGFRLAPALIAAGKLDEAEATLEKSARSGGTDDTAARHYAAFLAALGKLDPAWEKWRDASDEPGRRVAFALARLRGDRDAIQTIAEALKQPEATEISIFDRGDWTKYAQYQFPNLTPGVYNAGQVGIRAKCYRLTGNEEKRNTALDELRKLPQTTLRYPAPPLVFQALIYNHQVADALASLDKVTGQDAIPVRFEILSQMHRDDEALALLSSQVPARTPIRWGLDAARLRFHLVRGQMEEYSSLLKSLRINQPSMPVQPTETLAVTDFIEQLGNIDRHDDALPFVAALLASEGKPAELFEKVAPRTPLAYEAWWWHLRRTKPGDPADGLIERLPALSDSRLTSPENKKLLEEATTAAVAQPGEDGGRLLRGFGEACQAAGLEQEALRLYSLAAERSPAGWVKLGELHAERGRWPQAAEAFEKAAQLDSKQPFPMWMAGFAKIRAGQPGGEKLMERAHALPLADEDARVKFGEELAKRTILGPELGEAARRERRLVVRLGKPVSSFARTAQSQLSGDPLAFTDRLDAADATDRFLIRMMRSISYFKSPSAYVTVLLRGDIQRAAGLMAKGEVDAALKIVEEARTLLPASPTITSVIVPELDKRNRKADAEKLYREAAKTLDSLIGSHPSSAQMRTNRAWLAARCRRDLDDAVNHARKATELSPKDTLAWESLAEVQFQRGQKADALAAIGKCRELSPRSSYYQQQFSRIESGNREAPLPEGVLR